CLHHFFRQSEQLKAGIIAVSRQHAFQGQEHYAAAALMLQRLPDKESLPALDDDIEDPWLRALVLLGTATADEMLDPYLSSNDLLYRLFWEDSVKAYPSRPLVGQCRCSKQRVQRLLSTFSKDALEEMIIDNKITSTCEFCNTTYTFTAEEIIKIL